MKNGQLFLRSGEHALIQAHFKLMRFNRQMMKKSVKNFAHKTAVQEQSYKPELGKKTERYAANRRSKLMQENKSVNIVSILLHPNNTQGDKFKID